MKCRAELVNGRHIFVRPQSFSRYIFWKIGGIIVRGVVKMIGERNAKMSGKHEW